MKGMLGGGGTVVHMYVSVVFVLLVTTCLYCFEYFSVAARFSLFWSGLCALVTSLASASPPALSVHSRSAAHTLPPSDHSRVCWESRSCP